MKKKKDNEKVIVKKSKKHENQEEFGFVDTIKEVKKELLIDGHDSDD